MDIPTYFLRQYLALKLESKASQRLVRILQLMMAAPRTSEIEVGQITLQQKRLVVICNYFCDSPISQPSAPLASCIAIRQSAFPPF